MMQCQNIVNVLNEYKMLQPKLGNLEMLTNENNKSEPQRDIGEELIQVETDENVLSKSNNQPVTSGEINDMVDSTKAKF